MTDLKAKLAQAEESAQNAMRVPISRSLDLIRTPSDPATLSEAEMIWPILKASLDLSKGYGVAGCQIGLLKKVAYIVYPDPITNQPKEVRLLNTRIVERSGETIVRGEGCLSMPGNHRNTLRYKSITVIDDILGKVSLDSATDGLLPLIVQHEVDHFEGVTILDRVQQPVVHAPKIGRNDPCACGSGKKMKKCCR